MNISKYPSLNMVGLIAGSVDDNSSGPILGIYVDELLFCWWSNVNFVQLYWSVHVSIDTKDMVINIIKNID